jgi:ABC-type glycerol-3-phosphate transport system substrate-binding protein
MGGGAWYLTNTGSPEVQAGAWDFMKFFNSESSQVTWNLRGGYLPYRTSAVDTPAIQASWTDTLAGRWSAIAYNELLNGVDRTSRVAHRPLRRVRAAIRKSIDDLAFNNTAPADVVSVATTSTVNMVISSVLPPVLMPLSALT